MKEELIEIFFPGVIHSGFQIKYICQLSPETRILCELTLMVSVWFSETQGLGWFGGWDQDSSAPLIAERAKAFLICLCLAGPCVLLTIWLYKLTLFGPVI